MDELIDEERGVNDGSADWQRWWTQHGERELRCILMSAWDPLGVREISEAWDEYHHYLLGVAHRLRDAANEDDAEHSVREYLDEIEKRSMGVTNTHPSEKTVTLASVLVE